MTIRLLASPPIAAALFCTVAAFAQPTPRTDVGPPPAEDRDSTGAVVLEKSMVRAQKEKAFERSSARTGVGTTGRGVLRATSRAMTQAELASAREAEASELQRRGAASLTGK